MKKILLSLFLACVSYFSYAQCIENLSVQTLSSNPTCETSNELTATFTNKDNTDYTIKWYQGIDTTGNLISENDNLTVTNKGFYTVEISEKNNPSCKAIFTTEEIIFLPKPSTFLVNSATPLICSADSALFVISPINANITYTWEFEQNVKKISKHTTSGDSVYVHFNTSSNNFFETGKLIVKQTDLTTGCTTLDSDATIHNFNITTTPEILDSIALTTQKHICDGSEIEFTAHGGKVQYDYVWETDFSTTTTLLNVGDKSTILNASFDLQGTLDTLTNISIAQNNSGCIGDRLTTNFIINPHPSNTTFSGTDSVCTQTAGYIKVNKSDPKNTLVWKLNGFESKQLEGKDSINLFFTSNVEWTILETNKFGCTTTHTYTTYLKEQPNHFNIIANKSLLCANDTTIMYQIDPKDVEQTSTYTWTHQGDAINALQTDGNNADSVFVKFKEDIVQNTFFALRAFATNKYGCSTLADSVHVITNIVSICQVVSTTQTTNNNITITPNPFNNETIISVNTPSSIVVYDINGKIVENFDKVNKIVVGNNLATGVYFVSVQNENGVFYQKIIKQ